MARPEEEALFEDLFAEPPPAVEELPAPVVQEPLAAVEEEALFEDLFEEPPPEVDVAIEPVEPAAVAAEQSYLDTLLAEYAAPEGPSAGAQELYNTRSDLYASPEAAEEAIDRQALKVDLDDPAEAQQRALAQLKGEEEYDREFYMGPLDFVAETAGGLIGGAESTLRGALDLGTLGASTLLDVEPGAFVLDHIKSAKAQHKLAVQQGKAEDTPEGWRDFYQPTKMVEELRGKWYVPDFVADQAEKFVDPDTAVPYQEYLQERYGKYVDDFRQHRKDMYKEHYEDTPDGFFSTLGGIVSSSGAAVTGLAEGLWDIFLTGTNLTATPDAYIKKAAADIKDPESDVAWLDAIDYDADDEVFRNWAVRTLARKRYISDQYGPQALAIAVDATTSALGLQGAEAAKEAWATDLPGSLMSLVPVAAVGKMAAVPALSRAKARVQANAQGAAAQGNPAAAKAWRDRAEAPVNTAAEKFLQGAEAIQRNPAYQATKSGVEWAAATIPAKVALTANDLMNVGTSAILTPWSTPGQVAKVAAAPKRFSQGALNPDNLTKGAADDYQDIRGMGREASASTETVYKQLAYDATTADGQLMGADYAFNAAERAATLPEFTKLSEAQQADVLSVVESATARRLLEAQQIEAGPKATNAKNLDAEYQSWLGDALKGLPADARKVAGNLVEPLTQRWGWASHTHIKRIIEQRGGLIPGDYLQLESGPVTLVKSDTGTATVKDSAGVEHTVPLRNLLGATWSRLRPGNPVSNMRLPNGEVVERGWIEKIDTKDPVGLVLTNEGAIQQMPLSELMVGQQNAAFPWHPTGIENGGVVSARNRIRGFGLDLSKNALSPRSRVLDQAETQGYAVRDRSVVQVQDLGDGVLQYRVSDDAPWTVLDFTKETPAVSEGATQNVPTRQALRGDLEYLRYLGEQYVKDVAEMPQLLGDTPLLATLSPPRRAREVLDKALADRDFDAVPDAVFQTYVEYLDYSVERGIQLAKERVSAEVKAKGDAALAKQLQIWLRSEERFRRGLTEKAKVDAAYGRFADIAEARDIAPQALTDLRQGLELRRDIDMRHTLNEATLSRFYDGKRIGSLVEEAVDNALPPHMTLTEVDGAPLLRDTRSGHAKAVALQDGSVLLDGFDLGPRPIVRHTRMYDAANAPVDMYYMRTAEGFFIKVKDDLYQVHPHKGELLTVQLSEGTPAELLFREKPLDAEALAILEKDPGSAEVAPLLPMTLESVVGYMLGRLDPAVARAATRQRRAAEAAKPDAEPAA